MSRQVPKFSTWRSPTARTLRGLGEVGTYFRPELRPAVVGGAEEHEDVLLHVRVFQAEVFLIDAGALGQPGFELARGFDYVHAGNDSGWGMGSQMLKPLHRPDAEAHREWSSRPY